MKALREAARRLQAEPIPPFEQREEYMQENLVEGERIATLGPDHYVDAAVHFCRALRVFPQPVELLMGESALLSPSRPMALRSGGG